MIKQLLQVKLFMDLFEQKYSLQPLHSAHESLVGLGVKLAREEQREFEDSFSYPDEEEHCRIDQVDCLDALCDQLYILLGNVHRFGFGLIFPAAFRLVHESNMTKLWTNEEIQDAVQRGKLKNCRWKQVAANTDKSWIVFNEHGKVLKSPSYQPVDLHSMLDELEGQTLLDFSTAHDLIFADDDPDEVEPNYDIVFTTEPETDDDEEDTTVFDEEE